MEHNNNNNKRIPNSAVAFLVGAVAGGITALLLAPESGAELRGRIRRRAEDLREKGKGLAETGHERVESVTGALMSAATEAKQTYKSELERQREARATPGGEKRYAEADLGSPRPRPGQS